MSRLASTCLRRPQGQLLVGAVHRIAGLEGHHATPSQARELRAHLRRSQPQSAEIIVRGHVHLPACRRYTRDLLVQQVV